MKSHNRINSELYLKKLFWLGFATFIFGWVFFQIECYVRQNELLKLSEYQWILFGYLLFIILFLILFLIRPYSQLSKQKIRYQPSWIFYAYFSLILSPSVSWLIKAMLLEDFSIDDLKWRLLVFFVFWEVYIRIPVFDLKKENRRFAPGAVNSLQDRDKLGFSFPAENVCKGLQGLSDYISVIGLFGGFGSGKSSYARMIVEKFDSSVSFK